MTIRIVRRRSPQSIRLRPAAGRGSQHPPGQLVVDVKPDDVVEVALDELESQRSSPRGVEVARPTLYDARDDSIGLAPDPPHNAVAGDAAQRRDLLGDRD